MNHVPLCFYFINHGNILYKLNHGFEDGLLFHGDIWSMVGLTVTPPRVNKENAQFSITRLFTILRKM